MDQINIISIEFLGFVLATLAIYYLLPGKLQNLFLLIASYFFYSTWSGFFVWALAGVTLINFGFGLWLQKSETHKKAILRTGIVINIAILAWYLVGGPYVRSLPSLSVEMIFKLFPIIILPVGISYYTLNGISYLIDISLRLSKPTTNLIDFALYLAYFPKLISGPLERARKFLPLLAEKRVVDNAQIASSLTLILVGLFRAAILSGVFALLLPGSPLQDPAHASAPALIWAMLTFMFFIYNQFAGYTDIVRGVSGLYGIPLTRNFMQPFFSKDFSDFWQRWHISLSQWLRDYIYMPTSRAFLRRNPSRTNIPNLIVPPLATMLVSGLWHGATPNLVLWGFLMGLFIVIENIRMLYRAAVPQKNIPAWRRALGLLSLVILMLIATAPFDMDLKHTLAYYRQLVFGWDATSINFLPGIVIVFSLLLDWIQSVSNDETVFLKWPVWSQAFLAVSITMGTIIIQQLQSAPPVFVYP
jgi:D-alanyl-lipoteichoic acid acyltransferase DltB (MBOAT superfamily)